ncbi:tetratricopeptide repeat protein, partial [Sphingobacterium spiritivorum]
INAAIEALDKELDLNPDNWKAFNYRGFCFLKNKNYPEAFLNFEAAINIDNNQSESWGFLGTYYLILKNKQLAEECFKKVEQLELTEISNSQLAYYYYSINDYNTSQLYVDKTLSINSKNESALNTQGLLFIEKNEYKNAIKIFKELISLNKDISIYYNNLGHAFQLDKKLYSAQKNLEKALKLDNTNAYAYNNLAVLHNEKLEIKEAWEYICKATELDQDNPKFWVNKGELLFSLIKSGQETEEKLEDVGYYFYRGSISTVDAISALKDSVQSISEEDIDQIINGMLNMDIYFSATTNNCNVDKNFYHYVYKISLEIIALLNASEVEEFYFSHYTTEETSNTLIFNNSPFRLNSVTTANDPREGYPLLNFLGFTGPYSPNIYQAFVGSFTFNSDSLNQFRLYGKRENVEGSGIGLELSFNYFAKNIEINNSLISPKKEINNNVKQSIFRCIYLDPISRRVISVGYKEPCVFYRENNEDKNIVDDKVKKYLSKIENIKNKVEILLEKLSGTIHKYYNNEKDSDKKHEIIRIVPSLLIHLRYLVKHYDFKEEQECRIIQVEPLIDNPKIKTTQDFSRMYLEYLPFRKASECFLTNIYFGPKTTNFELFKDRITQLNSNILCLKNDHPFN